MQARGHSPASLRDELDRRVQWTGTRAPEEEGGLAACYGLALTPPLRGPLAPPEVTESPSFELVRTLGDSDGLSVMLVECSGLRCVVKAYLLTALSREDQYSVRRMIFIHSSISDDNIADFYAAWEDRDHIYVCMEYVGDRTLREFAASSGPLSEDTVRALLTAPMNTLARLHAAGVVHRDLTVDNFVLREDGRVKIVDLEHMVCIRWERPTRHVTTLAYTAPEVLKQPAEYAIESDVWSMALVCLECLTGAQPFLQDTPEKTCAAIRRSAFHLGNFPPRPALSATARDWLARGLEPSVYRRPTMPELLRHAWLKDAQEALHGPEAAVDGKALTTFQAETMATATLARVTSKRGAEKARALEEAAKLCEHLISEGLVFGVDPMRAGLTSSSCPNVRRLWERLHQGPSGGRDRMQSASRSAKGSLRSTASDTSKDSVERLGVERKAPASSRLLPDIAVRAAGVAQGSPRSPTSPPDAWPGKRQSDGGVTFPVEVPANRD